MRSRFAERSGVSRVYKRRAAADARAMLLVLLAAVAAPVYPDVLAVAFAVYTDCSPALGSKPVYCSMMVPTGSQLMCCEAAVQAPDRLLYRECVTSAAADTCPVLLKAGGVSWCCKFGATEEPHAHFYPWGDGESGV